MAGERYASFKMTGSYWGHGDYVEIWFKDHYQRFTYSNSTSSTSGFTGIIFTGGASGTFEDININRWNQLTQVIQNHITQRGWQSEFTVAHTSLPLQSNQITSIHTILITANQYGNLYNFNQVNLGHGPAWDITFEYLHNISPITITATTTFITCGGSSAGTINLSTQNVIGAATYQWSNGTTTTVPTLVNIPAGTYSVTVSDSQGTSSILNNIEVQENARLEIVATLGSNYINIAVTGGVGPYNYKWADGPITQNRINLATGSYTVTVTDANGCQRAGTFNLQTERFFFSMNPVPLHLVANDLENKPNLSFICEVWIEEVYLSENYTKVAVFEQPADASGKTSFYLERTLDAYLKPYFPEFKQKTLARADSAFKRFYLKHREKFGTPPVEAPVATQDVKFVICGGLDFEEYAAQTYFTSFLPYQKGFFTWQPKERFIFADQPEYLFFMPFKAGVNYQGMTVIAKLYYEDQTPETFAIHGGPVDLFELWCIPVGFELLNLQQYAPDKIITKYQVWVQETNSQAIISEVRTYVLETRYFRYKRYFHYANSLGGIDTLVATGAATLSLPVEAEMVRKNLVSGYDPAEGDSETVSKTGRPVLKLSTGYQLNRQERLALQDCRLSEKARLVGADRYLGGQLVFKDDLVDDEFEGAQAVEFEFHMASRSRYTQALRRGGYAAPIEAVPEPFDPTQYD